MVFICCNVPSYTITEGLCCGFTCSQWAVGSEWETCRVLSSALCSPAVPHSCRSWQVSVQSHIVIQWIKGKWRFTISYPTSIKPPPRTPHQIESERRRRGRSHCRGPAGTRPSRRSSPPAFPSPSIPIRSARTCNKTRSKAWRFNEHLLFSCIALNSRIAKQEIFSCSMSLSTAPCCDSYLITRTDGILQCLHVGSGEFKGPLHRKRVERSHSLALYLQVQPGVGDKRSMSETLAAIVSEREQAQRETVGPAVDKTESLCHILAKLLSEDEEKKQQWLNNIQ